jgi:hypothetical protein
MLANMLAGALTPHVICAIAAPRRLAMGVTLMFDAVAADEIRTGRC